MAMDPKKWAQNKLGAGAPPGGPPKPPPPPPMGGHPMPPGLPTGPRGPVPTGSPPLFNPALTSQHLPPDQAQWAQAGGKSPERPDNPPGFVTDEGAWEKAKESVKKNWESYDEPWAVVMHVYKSMTGEG